MIIDDMINDIREDGDIYSLKANANTPTATIPSARPVW